MYDVSIHCVCLPFKPFHILSAGFGRIQCDVMRRAGDQRERLELDRRDSEDDHHATCHRN